MFAEMTCTRHGATATRSCLPQMCETSPSELGSEGMLHCNILCCNAKGAVLASNRAGKAAENPMLHALYLVHNLSDPAVRRRALMLREGGAVVTLAGFRRDDNPLARIDGLAPVELGTTEDGNFSQRLRAVARATAGLGRRLGRVPRPDVIVARNLEMLVLANRASRVWGDVPVVYECLDIHRLMLRGDAAGGLLRWVERMLGRRAHLLITSSPAFVEHYFERFGQIDLPIELVENKVLALHEGGGHSADGPLPDGPPWKIGWFGALRCRRSLAILSAFSRAMKGRFRIVLRGRPAYSEFDDFDAIVAREPYVEFHGPYRNPEDLPAIYGEVHFAWLIDFFEAGQNSDWLLPNRLYESCCHGAVPIAMAGTETARFLAAREIGLALPEVTPSAMVERLAPMTAEQYRAASSQVASIESTAWTCGPADCRALVSRLADVATRRRDGALLETWA